MLRGGGGVAGRGAFEPSFGGGVGGGAVGAVSVEACFGVLPPQRGFTSAHVERRAQLWPRFGV